jgi:Fe-Mn family superoxide dismutase
LKFLTYGSRKVTIGFPDDVKQEGSFKSKNYLMLMMLSAPTVSPLTLEMHYSKHYLTYTNNLNDAIVGTEYENQSIEDILSKLDLMISN